MILIGKRVYKIEFVPSQCKDGKNSEIYISEDYYYAKNGFKVSFVGCGVENCSLKNIEKKYYYEVLFLKGSKDKLHLRFLQNK